MTPRAIESILSAEIRRIRRELQQVESLSSFTLTMTATGRVHEGEVEVKFRLGDKWGDNCAEGGQLNNVVAEYLRRHGWNERNKPLCLPSPEDNYEYAPDAQDA